MSDIKVDYQLLEQVADNLKNQAGLVQQYVDDLGQRLQPLYQTWGTTNNTAFTAMSADEAQLKTLIGNIVELITRFSNTVTLAREMNMATDSQNAAKFGNYA